MICDYASSVQSSDEDSAGSPQTVKTKHQNNERPIDEQVTVSPKQSADQRNASPIHTSPSGRLNGRESRSNSESPKLQEKSNRELSRHRRSSHERHRRSYKESRSKRHKSRSHSRNSKHRHSSRRHRHSHRDRSSRDDHRGHRSRSRSHRHRKHRHRTRSSSSSDDHHSRRPHAPTVVRTESTQPVSKSPKASNTPTRSPSQDPKDTSKKEQISVHPPTIPSTTTSASASATAAVTTNTPTPSLTTTTSGLRMSTQELLNQIQKHQEAQAKAQAIAAAAAANLPKYYNPSSVNAVKLAEQQQKRKLLWSKKNDANTNSDSKTALWTTTSLIAGKGDTAAAAKFRKLMGIHDTTEQSEPVNVPECDTQMQAEAQAELFRRLEHEYEMSRALTHTQRGVGLGFSSATHVDYSAYTAMQDEPKQKDGP